MYRIIIFILLLGYTSQAQVIDRVIASPSYSGKGIVIKWIPDEINYVKGYNIYRSIAGNASWQKLNDEPINKIPPLPDAYRSLPEELLKSYAIGYEKPRTYFRENDAMRAFIYLDILRSQELGELLGLVWIDESASPGQSYQYKVEGLIESGVESIGVSNNVTTGNYDYLPEPQNISIDRKRDGVYFKWDIDESRSVATYIRKSTNGGRFENLFEIPVYVAKKTNDSGEKVYPEVYFVDRDIKKGEDYRYRLAAVDFFGQTGEFSPIIDMAERDLDPPPAPTNIQLSLDEPNFRGSISWDYSSTPDDFKGYIILSRNSIESEPNLLHPDTLSAGINSVELNFPGTGNYIISVAAVDQANNISESEYQGAEINDFVPPASPSELSLDLEEGNISFGWKAPEDKDVLGYYLYRYLGNKDKPDREDFVVLNNEPIIELQYSELLDEVLTGNIYYSVSAVDSAFNRSELAAPATILLPDKNAPSDPVIKGITLKDNAVQLNWYPNVDSDLQNFILYRAEDDKSEIIATLNPLDTTYIDNSVKAGRRYEYYMVAVDISGNQSLESGRTSILIPENDLDILKNIKPRNIQLRYMKNKNHAAVWWDQNFTSENLGVVIYKGESEDNLKPVSGLLKEAEFRDEKVTPGNTYYYQLRTYASNGAKDYSIIKTLKIKAE